MGVGDVVPAHGSAVARDGVLGDGVGNLGAVGIFGLAGEAPAPAIRSRDRLAGHLGSVGLQTDGDAGGTFAVLVVRVIPGFGAGDVDSLGCVGVGEGEDVVPGRHGGGVVMVENAFGNPGAGHGRELLHRVGDGHAVLLGQQVAEGTAVLAAGINFAGHRGCGGVVLEQAEGHGLRAEAVLVAGIVPRLVEGDVHSLGRVAVGDVVAADVLLVAFHGTFIHAVGDGCAHGTDAVDRQSGELILPVAGCAADLHAVDLLAVGEKQHAYAGRTGAVNVLFVVPGLGTGDVDGLRRMRVGDGVSVHDRCVLAGDRRF